ncbi:glucosamine inositolphosphorylceramide transferase family protein [Falsiroseomonas sp. HW251]|uniref:glucosamine inositolphosphorylceramide transferase family protein n=1 Tax=Falsiroseomonas sp. HW251 TaxID=3390998 RepID=UPI003D31FDFC
MNEIAASYPPTEVGRHAASGAAAPICLLVPRVLRWHLDLLTRLARELPGARPRLVAAGRATTAGFVLRHRVPGLQPGDVEPERDAPPDGVAIDLTGAAVPAGAALQPLFDGRPGDAALLNALLAGRNPHLQVRRSGEVVAQGSASLDAANTLGEAFDAVIDRLGLLLARLQRVGPDDAVPAAAVEPALMPGARAVLRDSARRFGTIAARGLFRLAFQPGHWRIGWRLVDGDVWSRGDLGGVPWNVLPSPPDAFYADPFVMTHKGRQALFFEEFDRRRGKGHLAAIECGAQGPEGPVMTVLDMPWHLSYPQVFEHAGEAWMVPESIGARRVTLYRAVRFPDRWEREADLLTDIEANDPTLLFHEGRWWMFATVGTGAGSGSDVLCIFVAPSLTGPWRAHRANPVLLSGEAARAAGVFLRREGKLWRPVQECGTRYGAALGLAEVTRLDEGGFAQVVRHAIPPGGPWPGRRLHTLNRDGRLEVIDGSARVPRIAFWGKP